MRKSRYALLAGLVLSLVGGVSAQAASISGSQAFGVASLNADSTDLAAITQLTVQLLSTTGSSQQTGNYVGFPATIFAATTLNTASLSSFSFTDAAFGTFTANLGTELSSPVDTRTFYITGNFARGTAFSSFTGNTASLLISLNQSGGAGGAIGFTATFNTPAAPPPGVPEPASMSLAGIGLGLVGLLLGHRSDSGK